MRSSYITHRPHERQLFRNRLPQQQGGKGCQLKEHERKLSTEALIARHPLFLATDRILRRVH